MNSKQFSFLSTYSSRALTGLFFVSTLLLLGCTEKSSDQISVANSSKALSSTNARILGFESPLADWNSSAPLSVSNNVTQGSASLAVVPSSWTEIRSIPMSSIGEAQSSLKLDLFVPSVMDWGEIRVIVKIPSQEIWYQELGSKPLTSISSGAYSTLEFQIPANVKQALAASYDDLEITIALSSPSVAQPYLLDNIVLAAEGSEDTDVDTGSESGQTETMELIISKPAGIPLNKVLLSATERLKVNERVTLGKSSEYINVASFDGGGTHFGAQMTTFGNLHSTGDVFLSSQTRVRGYVRSTGTITDQDESVSVVYGEYPGVPVTRVDKVITVEFPIENNGPVYLPPDDYLALNPGAWGSLDLQPRATLVLSSGTYFFESFNTEPESKIVLKKSKGPIYIYVKNSFVYKGGFVTATGQIGDHVVGYFGTQIAYLAAPMQGTIVAPNAKVELRRPPVGVHRCTAFAKEIEVFSDVPVWSASFPWDDVVPPDGDDDGVVDGEDECPINPNKSKMDIARCSDKPDSDGDGTLDEADECPDDPNNVRIGDCGCQGLDEGIKVGIKCNDGPIPGIGVCNNDGVCEVDDGDTTIPHPDCFFREWRNTYYWFCDVDVTREQAADMCRDNYGRKMLVVGDIYEDIFINHILEQKSINNPMWLGANQLTTEGTWNWGDSQSDDAFTFWQVDANGEFQRMNHAYIAWSDDEPTVGSGNNCATTAPKDPACDDCDFLSGWQDESCGESHGFICEVHRKPDGHIPDGPVSMCDFFGCPEDEDDPDIVDDADDCQELDDIFSAYAGLPEDQREEAFHADVEACENCQMTAGESAWRSECVEECSGPLTPPEDGEVCRFNMDDDDPNCTSEGESCVANEDCCGGLLCKDSFCSAPFGKTLCRISVVWPLAQCNEDLQCESLVSTIPVPEGVVCGLQFTDLECPQSDDNPDDTDRDCNPEDETFENYYNENNGDRVCGFALSSESGEPNCFEIEDTNPCSVTEICSGEEAVGGELNEDELKEQLSPDDWDPQEIMPQDAGVDVDEYPPDPPCVDSAGNEKADCGEAGFAHRWCHVFNEDSGAAQP